MNHNSMPSQFRGVYGRVARKIGVDASYVSRVAGGERQSKRIADALQQAIGRIVRKKAVSHRIFYLATQRVIRLPCVFGCRTHRSARQWKEPGGRSSVRIAREQRIK